MVSCTFKVFCSIGTEIGEIRVLRIESQPCHKYRDDSIRGGDNESVVFFSGEGGQVRHDGNR